MAKQFQEQGGASTMDPSPLLRWLTSRIVKRVCGDASVSKRRAKVERARLKSGQAHVVEYFHYVEDGYSHLAVQVLQAFADRYDIELVCHLVRGPQGDNSAEPELLLGLSRYDSFHVAKDYGLNFPQHENAPDQALVKLASSTLAALDSSQFIECAAQVGDALWSGHTDSQRGIDHLEEALATYEEVRDERRAAQVHSRLARVFAGIPYDQVRVTPRHELYATFNPTDESGTPIESDEHPLNIARYRREPAHRRFWLTGVDGVQRKVECTAIPLIGQSGRMLGASGFFWEIGKS